MLTDAGVVGVFLLRVMTECLKLSTYRAHRHRCSWCVSTESDGRMFKTEYLPCSQTQV